MGKLAGGFEYPAVHAAIARFERRLKSDRDLQKKFKKIARKLKIEICFPSLSHPRTLRLKEIQYRLDAVKKGYSRRLFRSEHLRWPTNESTRG